MPRKEKKIKRPQGVPPKTIEWERVDRLLQSNCKGTEIAARLGIHPDTLYDRCEAEKGVVFSAYAQSKRESGNSYIREKQYHKAIVEGNTTVLMHLFKHRLGEWDKIPENEATEEKESQFNALMNLLAEIQLRSASNNATSTIINEK